MALRYGIIGNCKTAALVSENGSLEWCCFPRFDSPSIFAKLLDTEKGGSFEIHPEGKYRISQRYDGNTNVLTTHFSNDDAEFTVIDYFPFYRVNGNVCQVNAMHRVIRTKRGTPRLKVHFNPQLNYARGVTVLTEEDEHTIGAHNGNDAVYCYASTGSGPVMRGEPIEIAEEAYFIISFGEPYTRCSREDIDKELAKTTSYWETYIARRYVPYSEYRAQIVRSILALKLLTYHDTGAVVAAVTTSLPEVIGSNRTWDYRYCWLRDASFTVDAFTAVHSFEEAESFLRYLMHVCRKHSGTELQLQVVYGVSGETQLTEEVLDHLAGYRNSRPVRIGNAAHDQLQIDVIGEVIDAIYNYFVQYHYVARMTDEQFGFIEQLVEETIRTWHTTDHGIWEFRTITEHFVSSKVLAWVALDRGIKIAEAFRKHCDIDRWRTVRDDIKRNIHTNGWSEKMQSFTMSYSSDCMDASVLLMRHYGFIHPTDDRFIRTVRAIERELVQDGLVMRYRRTDDFGEPSNSFTIATLWYIDALYAIGEREKARELFGSVCALGNHLHLFSEDIDLRTKELTGNFPQAYAHIALINTALLLENSTNHG